MNCLKYKININVNEKKIMYNRDAVTTIYKLYINLTILNFMLHFSIYFLLLCQLKERYHCSEP